MAPPSGNLKSALDVSPFTIDCNSLTGDAILTRIVPAWLEASYEVATSLASNSIRLDLATSPIIVLPSTRYPGPRRAIENSSTPTRLPSLVIMNRPCSTLTGARSKSSNNKAFMTSERLPGSLLQPFQEFHHPSKRGSLPARNTPHASDTVPLPALCL